MRCWLIFLPLLSAATASAVVAVEIPRFEETPAALAISPDGEVLAVGTEAGLMQVWSLSSTELIFEKKPDDPTFASPVRGLAFSPGGRLLASGGADQFLFLWHVANGMRVNKRHAHQGWIYSVAFSPDGKRVATASQDARVRIWSVSDLEQELDIDAGAYAMNLSWSEDGDTLYFANGMAELRQIDAADGSLVRQIPEVNEYSIAPQSGHFALVNDGHFTIHAGDASEAIHSRSDADYSGVEYSPDGKFLVLGDSSGLLTVLDTTDYSKIATQRAHARHVSELVFSPDGKYLVSSGGDGWVRTWDMHAIISGIPD